MTVKELKQKIDNLPNDQLVVVIVDDGYCQDCFAWESGIERVPHFRHGAEYWVIGLEFGIKALVIASDTE